MNEAMMEWYKQTIVPEDSDSDGPPHLLDEYDGVSNVCTIHAEVDGVFIKDVNTQRQLEEQIIVRAFKIG